MKNVTKKLALKRAEVPALAAVETKASEVAPSPTMPPPTKAPKQNPAIDQSRVNEVFAKNLEEMIRWYRRASSGPDLGSNVIIEIVLRDVSLAWSLALQGKNWTPPTPTP